MSEEYPIFRSRFINYDRIYYPNDLDPYGMYVDADALSAIPLEYVDPLKSIHDVMQYDNRGYIEFTVGPDYSVSGNSITLSSGDGTRFDMTLDVNFDTGIVTFSDGYEYRVAGHFDGLTARASADVGTHDMSEGYFALEVDKFGEQASGKSVFGFGNSVNWDYWPGAIAMFKGPDPSNGGIDSMWFRIVNDAASAYGQVRIPIITAEPAIYEASWDKDNDLMTITNGVDSDSDTILSGSLSISGQPLQIGGAVDLGTSKTLAVDAFYKRATYSDKADGSNIVADYVFESPTAVSAIPDIISGNDATLIDTDLEDFWVKSSEYPEYSFTPSGAEEYTTKAIGYFDPDYRVAGYFDGNQGLSDVDVGSPSMAQGRFEVRADFPRDPGVQAIKDPYFSSWTFSSPDYWNPENLTGGDSITREGNGIRFIYGGGGNDARIIASELNTVANHTYDYRIVIDELSGSIAFRLADWDKQFLLVTEEMGPGVYEGSVLATNTNIEPPSIFRDNSDRYSPANVVISEYSMWDTSKRTNFGDIIVFGDSGLSHVGSTSMFLYGNSIVFRMSDAREGTGGNYKEMWLDRLDGMTTYTATWDSVSADELTFTNGVDSGVTSGLSGFVTEEGFPLSIGSGRSHADPTIVYAPIGTFELISYSDDPSGNNLIVNYDFKTPTVIPVIPDTANGYDAVLDVTSLEDFWVKKSAYPEVGISPSGEEYTFKLEYAPQYGHNIYVNDDEFDMTYLSGSADDEILLGYYSDPVSGGIVSDASTTQLKTDLYVGDVRNIIFGKESIYTSFEKSITVNALSADGACLGHCSETLDLGTKSFEFSVVAGINITGDTIHEDYDYRNVFGTWSNVGGNKAGQISFHVYPTIFQFIALSTDLTNQYTSSFGPYDTTGTPHEYKLIVDRETETAQTYLDGEVIGTLLDTTGLEYASAMNLNIFSNNGTSLPTNFINLYSAYVKINGVTVANFGCEEGVGNTLHDASIEGNDCTLQNPNWVKVTDKESLNLVDGYSLNAKGEQIPAQQRDGLVLAYDSEFDDWIGVRNPAYWQSYWKTRNAKIFLDKGFDDYMLQEPNGARIHFDQRSGGGGERDYFIAHGDYSTRNNKFIVGNTYAIKLVISELTPGPDVGFYFNSGGSAIFSVFDDGTYYYKWVCTASNVDGYPSFSFRTNAPYGPVDFVCEQCYVWDLDRPQKTPLLDVRGEPLEYQPGDVFAEEEIIKLPLPPEIEEEEEVVPPELPSGFVDNMANLSGPTNYGRAGIAFQWDAMGMMPNPDGDKIIILHGERHYQVTNFREYSMTDFDLNTIAFVREFRPTVDQWTSATKDLTISDDGLNLIVYEYHYTHKIRHFRLSSPWDITSIGDVVYELDLDTLGWGQTGNAICVSLDGKYIYIARNSTPKRIEQLELGTEWELSTWSNPLKGIDTTDLYTTIRLNRDGDQMLGCRLANQYIDAINFGTPFDIETASVHSSKQINSSGKLNQFFTKPDGTQIMGMSPASSAAEDWLGYWTNNL